MNNLLFQGLRFATDVIGLSDFQAFRLSTCRLSDFRLADLQTTRWLAQNRQ
jgi:hypothetical protein